MIITLTSGETIFNITTGVTRNDRALTVATRALNQDTQVELPTRAEWPVAFPERASRTLTLPLPVLFPACASLEAAFAEYSDIPMQCPRGGVLTLAQGAVQRSYSQAWLRDCQAESIGVRNRFTFIFSVINPSAVTLSPLAQMDSRYLNILSSLTGGTGGESTKLDGLVTADVDVGRWVKFMSGVEPQEWQLITDPDPGVTAEDESGGIILPDDYDDEDNAKIWIRRA